MNKRKSKSTATAKPSPQFVGSVLHQATTLRQIAEWCDNPNLSPPAAIKIKTTSIDVNLFSTGFLLRLIAECYESKAPNIEREPRGSAPGAA